MNVAKVMLQLFTKLIKFKTAERDRETAKGGAEGTKRSWKKAR